MTQNSVAASQVKEMFLENRFNFDGFDPTLRPPRRQNPINHIGMKLKMGVL
jgi:hypothetical protein